MKGLLQSLFVVFAAVGFLACSDDHDEPELDSTPKMLASDMDALRDIYSALDMDDEYYPVHWDLDDPSTWEGIELDTIVDGETAQKAVVVKSMTLYLAKPGAELPDSLKNLSYLYELKIYGCGLSLFDGRKIPNTVKELLVDRIDPDDPNYIVGISGKSITSPNEYEVSLNYWAQYKKITIHGVQMNRIGFNSAINADIDLSYNTLSGVVNDIFTTYLNHPADLSHNRFSSFDFSWKYLISDEMPLRRMPNLQYNKFEEIPDYVLESDFWKAYHDRFIGNEGYVAPVK